MNPGQRIRDYVLESKIGQGGMGEVWRARHVLLDKVVAIKVLTEQLQGDSAFNDRFVQEARAQARLQHPRIVGVTDFFRADEGHCFVMPLIEGESLEARIARNAGALPTYEAVRIARDLLDALDHAHQKGVIHRDVKPSNILLDGDGHAHLSDFGIALLVGVDRRTRTGHAVGTPHYMSPEQIKRPKGIDHRTDVYSAGCVVYEMLTGRTPFATGEEEDTEWAIKEGHVNRPPPPPRWWNAAISPELEAVVLKALAKNPDARFSGCGEFAFELTEAAKETAQASQSSVSPTTAAPSTAVAPVVSAAPSGQEPGQQVLKAACIWIGSLLDSGNLTGAGDALTAARAAHGDAPEIAALEDRLEALTRKQRTREAQAILDEAKGSVAAGRVTEAAQGLARASALDPEHPDLLVVRRKIEAARKDRELEHSAAEAAERVFTLLGAGKLDKAEAALKLAEANCGQRASLGAAREAFANAVREHRKAEVNALIDEARSFIRSSAYGDARRVLRLAASFEPGHPGIQDLLSEIERGEQRLRAEAAERERLEALKREADAALEEARQYLAAGTLDEAKATLDRAAGLPMPEELIAELRRLKSLWKVAVVRGVLQRGRDLLNIDDGAGARDAAVEALELEPGSPEARVLLEQSDAAIARLAREETERRETARRQVVVQEIRRLVHLSRFDEARSEFQEAAADGGWPELHEAGRALDSAVADEAERERQRIELVRRREAEAAEVERLRREETRRREEERQRREAEEAELVQREVEEARRREEDQIRRDAAEKALAAAREAVAVARDLFGGGQQDAALAALRSFSPPHDFVDKALRELESRFAAIEERRRQDAARQRTPEPEEPALEFAPAALPKAPGLTAAAKLAALLVVAAAVLGGAFVVMRMARRNAPSDAGDAQASPSPAVQTAPAAPARPAVVRRWPISLNALPWARVRIKPVGDGEAPALPADQSITPLFVELAEGEYTVEFENGGVSGPLTQRIQIRAGRENTFTFQLPGYDAERAIASASESR